MIYFKHDTAIVETPNVGRDTKVWAYVHILPGAKIGSECNICDHCFIENDVLIGDRVTLKCGIYLWDGVEIADDVFILKAEDARKLLEPPKLARIKIAPEYVAVNIGDKAMTHRVCIARGEVQMAAVWLGDRLERALLKKADTTRSRFAMALI